VFESLSISVFGSRSIQSSTICVIVLSLFAAYWHNLFNLRVDILKLNRDYLIMDSQ